MKDDEKKYYSDNLTEFGIDPRTVGWGSRESQYLRFFRLLNGINIAPDDTILDIGAGLADLFVFMTLDSVGGQYTALDLPTSTKG